METHPTLSHDGVTLRRIRPEDRADRLRSGRDPELVRMYGGDYRRPTPMTAKDAIAWYEQFAAEPLGWAIEMESRCIGTARLHSLAAADRRARYAIGIFERSCWGRGIGSIATRLVLRYAFETLHLHRVDLRVLEYNLRAIRCYAKCGFVREGLEREGALVAGEWHSDVLMSILEQEYWLLAPEWWGLDGACAG